MIIDNLEKFNLKKNDIILEVGIGCGIVSLFMAKLTKNVTGVDINSHAVELSKKNAKLNNVVNVSFFESDLFDKIDKKSKYDLIIFNLPYVPTEEIINEPIAKAWDGGADGRKVIDRFLLGCKGFLADGGSVVFLESSLSSYEKSVEYLEDFGFKVEIAGRKKLSFEELVVIRAKLL